MKKLAKILSGSFLFSAMILTVFAIISKQIYMFIFAGMCITAFNETFRFYCTQD